MGCAASKTVGDLVRDAARRDDLEELKELLQSHEGKDAESLRDVINSTDSRVRHTLSALACGPMQPLIAVCWRMLS